MRGDSSLCLYLQSPGGLNYLFLCVRSFLLCIWRFFLVTVNFVMVREYSLFLHLLSAIRPPSVWQIVSTEQTVEKNMHLALDTLNVGGTFMSWEQSRVHVLELSTGNKVDGRRSHVRRQQRRTGSGMKIWEITATHSHEPDGALCGSLAPRGSVRLAVSSHHRNVYDSVRQSRLDSSGKAHVVLYVLLIG